MNAVTLQRRARGFSLVELMVAMTLSLVLLAGALSILYSTKVTNTENDRLARLQENGRAAIELLLRDARSAGYQGCMRPGFGQVRFDNLLPGRAQTLWNFEQPVYGFDGSGGAWTPALDAAVPAATPPSPDTDVLVLRVTRQGSTVFRLTAGMANGNSPLTVVGTNGGTAAVGDTMVVSDCSNSTAFTVTTFTPGSPASIGHSNFGYTYGPNSQVVHVDTILYYVADSTSGLGPALYRRIGDADPQILVEGVENMQVLYGESTGGSLLANVYHRADQVTDWNAVVSVTVSLLLRSEAEANLDVDTRTYTVLDTNFDPPDDRRQRSLFTSTATLRNRSR